MFIYREILDYFDKYYTDNKAVGLILAGIVGCGKSTAVSHFLTLINERYTIFRFTGDDVQFRQSVASDSRYLSNIIKNTKMPPFIFIDEVQKSEEVFDAIKIAFDENRASFLVTGSNPAYLATVAKKRLQRRADQLLMLPLSPRELLHHHALIPKFEPFEEILWRAKNLDEVKLPITTISTEIETLLRNFLRFGGLPLSVLASSEEEKLREIRLTTERGFELMTQNNNSAAEVIRVELAKIHSQEFTYKNIMDKTRMRQRRDINSVIDQLRNHGYLFKKSPYLLFPEKSSYLSTFSYTDPGIVNYLNYNGEVPKGFLIEGHIHSRLEMMRLNSVYKSELFYFKPHELDTNKNIRFKSGEIDFIFVCGNRIIPIEVKMNSNIHNIDTTLITNFVREQHSPFGIILYGGTPYADYSKKILYYPYWAV